MSDNEMRILAVDWGGKRLGLAISDETRTLARSLAVIQHTSRRENAEKIIEFCKKEGAGLIVVGVTFTEDGDLTPSGKSATRLIDEIHSISDIPAVHFDESGSTKHAKMNQIHMGGSKKKRRGHLDSNSAAIILQDYLDREKSNE